MYINSRAISFIVLWLSVLSTAAAQSYTRYYDSTATTAFKYKKVYRVWIRLQKNGDNILRGYLYRLDSNAVILSSINPKRINSTNRNTVRYTKVTDTAIYKLSIGRNHSGLKGLSVVTAISVLTGVYVAHVSTSSARLSKGDKGGFAGAGVFSILLYPVYLPAAIPKTVMIKHDRAVFRKQLQVLTKKTGYAIQ